MHDIYSEVMAFLAEIPAKTSIGPETELMENGLLNSTGLVRLITFLEATFGIRIDDGEVVAETFATPSTIVAFVETKRLAV